MFHRVSGVMALSRIRQCFAVGFHAIDSSLTTVSRVTGEYFTSECRLVIHFLTFAFGAAILLS